MAVSLAPRDRIGHVVGRRYQLLSILGEGGQGAVFRARDLRDGDEVAVKMLKPGADADSTERMFREANAMAQLHGTSAVRVLDQQWTEDGAMCLVTELLEGQPLDAYLESIEARGERASVALVVNVIEPVVKTLHAAHHIAIVHRDLKPANIFVLSSARGGGVRLIDFGFAKFQRLKGLTAEGMVAGSPSYIAPETWRNRKDVIDHRVDVYAIGAVIFRCLAGQPPFNKPDLIQLLKEVTTAPRPSLHAFRPDLPKTIDDWVQQALAIEPDERFQGVMALWRAFKYVVGA